MNKHIYLLIINLFLCFFYSDYAFGYTYFWDFRQWPNEKSEIYLDYMGNFMKHNITALILIKYDALPPFQREKKFLQDAKDRGINVWIRTNRVTPKKGFPGYSNGTLDFALNQKLQNAVLLYLEKLSRLSDEFPNLKGIVIGGEELIGAHIDGEELSRWDSVFFEKTGFHLTIDMTDNQKKIYFDWVQEINNLWYSRIYDYIHSNHPTLNLFIFPSSAAIDDANRYASHPRPAHWDLYDLIVVKNKPFSIIYESYNIQREEGIFYTGAQSAYIRDVTQGKVQFYTIHQAQQAVEEKTPPGKYQLNAHIFSSIVNGSDGVGFWATDMNTKQDVYYTDRIRWDSFFEIINDTSRLGTIKKIEPNIFVIKPRYSFFLDSFPNSSSFEDFITLYKRGFQVGFVLEENILKGALPNTANVFYLSKNHKGSQLEHILYEIGKNLIFFDERIDKSKTIEKLFYWPLGEAEQSSINVVSSPYKLLLHNPTSLDQEIRINWYEDIIVKGSLQKKSNTIFSKPINLPENVSGEYIH